MSNYTKKGILIAALIGVALALMGLGIAHMIHVYNYH